MSRSEDLYLGSPEWLQKLAVRLYGRKLFKKRYGGIYSEILDLVHKSNTWSASEVRQYQSEKLHQIVEHCYNNVPFYQELFADHGLRPSDITDVSDVRKIPILRKETVRQDPAAFLSGTNERSYAVQHTSGSTGTPLALHTDEYTYKLAMALLVDFEEHYGVRFGERRATFAGRILKKAMDKKPPFWRFNPAENQLLFSSYHINADTFPHYDKALCAFRPAEIIGYPSAIYELANQYHLNNAAPSFSPRLIVTNSENLLEWQRLRIEGVFGCKVRDYYSTAEYLNFAGEDENGTYRSSPLPGISEVSTDEEDLISGPIIMTSLTNYRMPLIRYEVGDVGTLLNSPSEFNGVPAFKAIEGRIDDYLETADGRKIGRVSQVFKGLPGIKEAQIRQHRPGHATLKVVLDGSSTHDDEKLLHNAKLRLGTDFNFRIDYVDEIPRGKNGKFRFVVKEDKNSDLPY